MQSAARDKIANAIPRKRQRHYSYDESVDEPAKLIENEPIEIEAEVPAEENEPVERIEREDEPASPAFEEDDPTT
ncbi:MAG: hypothetical protein ACLQIQ_19075 [Beijerinckiaceae bacterium]